jgi:hypothetical protein
MTQIWKMIALSRGWRAAYDVEDGRLVVFNDALSVHCYDWKTAAHWTVQ